MTVSIRNQRSNVVPPTPREPVTARGVATRSRLVAAARDVFAEKGFIDTRVTDITKVAESGSGTFYIYFDSKEAVLEAVIDEVMEELLATLRSGRPASSDPATLIAHDNERYAVAYRQHADIMRVMEQVATFNPHFATVRQSVRDRFVDRATRSIAAWVEQGECDSAVSPRTTAALLVAMNDNFCYNWLALGHDYAADEVVAGMNAVWTRSLGIAPRH